MSVGYSCEEFELVQRKEQPKFLFFKKIKKKIVGEALKDIPKFLVVKKTRTKATRVKSFVRDKDIDAREREVLLQMRRLN